MVITLMGVPEVNWYTRAIAINGLVMKWDNPDYAYTTVESEDLLSYNNVA